MLEAVSAILRGRNHLVHTANTLEHAKYELAHHIFDVVIADLHVSDTPSGQSLSVWLQTNQPALLQRLIWMRGPLQKILRAIRTPADCRFCRSPSKPEICWWL